MSYLTEPLDSKHDKENFSCGIKSVENRLWKEGAQGVKSQLSTCFEKDNKETEKISGYYTLSSSNISQNLIPDSFKKKLPKSYLSIPTILLGRLAIDKEFQGRGLGKILLIDALKRCCDTSESIGAYAVIVDPLDKEAEKFYEKYGFIKLPDSGKMFIPIKTIKELFE